VTQITAQPQAPIPPNTDLRNMLRNYLYKRSAHCMEQSELRRNEAIGGNLDSYGRTVTDAVRRFYGDMPVGTNAASPSATVVSSFEKRGYCIENVLFESFPGWQVNASVYIPLDYAPPYPAIVVAVGHSGKQFEAYQLPCQYFARAGYVAITFDPPGQASEKQVGNDHFNDGVRCYTVGETSSRYFIGDALRCIDYLETRDDVDTSPGVGMTGVSGGGNTTLFSAVLDERIAVMGPSCCATRLIDLDITQAYSGCPETHMWRRYADGIDEADLLCVAAPRPMLLMAGRDDEVFRIEDVQNMADEVQSFYSAADAIDRFKFFVDQGGHNYSLTQAREFTQFANRWLLNAPERSVPDDNGDSYTMNPYTELQCHPSSDGNMRTISAQRGRSLAAAYGEGDAVSTAAARICGVTEVAPPAYEIGDTFRVWTHEWRQAMIRPEEGIELPTTLLTPVDDQKAPLLLHFDDQGRHRLLKRQGSLAQAAGFLTKDEVSATCSVDLRGWGDTEPAVYPYDLASWGGTDRYLAYTSAALGDHVLAQRVRDGLATLRWLRDLPDLSPNRVVVSGCGLAGIVALHVAAIDGACDATVVWDTLTSFQSLIEAECYTWPADTFMPNVLTQYDLPVLAKAIHGQVCVLNPRDGRGERVSGNDFDALRREYGPIHMRDATTEQITETLRRYLHGEKV
jgi:dienelactone hydrolase